MFPKSFLLSCHLFAGQYGLPQDDFNHFETKNWWCKIMKATLRIFQKLWQHISWLWSGIINYLQHIEFHLIQCLINGRFSFIFCIFEEANKFTFLLLVSHFFRICGKRMWVELWSTIFHCSPATFIILRSFFRWL